MLGRHLTGLGISRLERLRRSIYLTARTSDFTVQDALAVGVEEDILMRSMKAFLVTTTVLCLAMNGCASKHSPAAANSESKAHQTPASAKSTSETSQQARNSSSLTATSPAPTSSNQLTGFGATLANWNARHSADSDPKLAPNCCYGPRIDTVDQAGSDTWAVAEAATEVYLYIRNFSKSTTRAEALAEIVHDDLPPDAKLVSSKIGDGCELFLYRSAMLAKSAPDLGDGISFDLHSGGDETVYYPNQISGADLSIGSDLGTC
jgi:hypothetical protein